MRSGFAFLITVTVTLCAPVLAYDWSANPGSGEAGDPYQISELNQLVAIGSDPNLLDKSFILMNDFVLDPINNLAHRFEDELISPYLTEYDVYTGEWVYTGIPFSGIFDGNNHTIHNLNIPLCGVVGIDGVICNVNIQDDYQIDSRIRWGIGLVRENYGVIASCQSRINAEFIYIPGGGTCKYSAYHRSNGLVGFNAGIIDSCVADTTFRGVGGSSVGGLVGENIGTISQSSVICDFSFSSLCNPQSGGIGGLVGTNRNGTIIDCHATGNVTIEEFYQNATGGLVGLNIENSTIHLCTSDCTVTGYGMRSSQDYPYNPPVIPASAGGLVGTNINSTIAECHYTGTTSDSGLIDYCFGGTILHCTSNANIADSYNGGLIGRCYESTIEHCVSDCNMIYSGEAGYSITGVIGGLIGYCKNSAVNSCQSSGTIDIGSASISSESIGGLVSQSQGSTIIHSSSTCKVYGKRSVGGLVGTSFNDHITDCYATGLVFGTSKVGGLIGLANNIVMSRCFATGTVNGIRPELGISELGGLVGSNYGNISMCYTTGCIVVEATLYSSGGFVGYNYGAITDCYSLGSVTAGNNSNSIGGFLGYNGYSGATAENCYSAGSVHTGDDSIAIGGFSSWGDGINCYFLDTAGPDNGYGTPLTDLQMKTQINFTDWDFVGENANGENEIWRMCVDGVDYPRLSWEFSQNGDFACGDGTDILDLQALAEHWLLVGTAHPTEFNTACDANGDGVIDLHDFSILGENW